MLPMCIVPFSLSTSTLPQIFYRALKNEITILTRFDPILASFLLSVRMLLAAQLNRISSAPKSDKMGLKPPSTPLAILFQGFPPIKGLRWFNFLVLVLTPTISLWGLASALCCRKTAVFSVFYFLFTMMGMFSLIDLSHSQQLMVVLRYHCRSTHVVRMKS